MRKRRPMYLKMRRRRKMRREDRGEKDVMEDEKEEE
jgi:hypothetical protein